MSDGQKIYRILDSFEKKGLLVKTGVSRGGRKSGKVRLSVKGRRLYRTIADWQYTQAELYRETNF